VLIRDDANVGPAFANVALERGQRRIEVLDHLLRRSGVSVRGIFSHAARLVHPGHRAVPGIETARAQHQ